MAVPTPTPVTTPPEVTVATPVEPLLQVPDGVPSASVTADPTQMVTGVAGVIAAGAARTVTVTFVEQPEGRVYVIIENPGLTPETKPVVGITVATVVVPLVQVPPPASVNAVVAPTQTVSVPVIGLGTAFTVIGNMEVQPPPYV